MPARETFRLTGLENLVHCPFVNTWRISHEKYLEPFMERALSDERVDALIVPIGRGVLVCRKV